MTQIPLSQTASADRPEYDKLRDDKTRQIAPDVAYRQIAIVNVVFVGQPGAGDGNWTLNGGCRARPPTSDPPRRRDLEGLAGQVPSY
jgi:hypothetical protein